ncbi:MAG: LamG-like jellyroll fold domain-containing protein [Bacteroidota bacterium]
MGKGLLVAILFLLIQVLGVAQSVENALHFDGQDDYVSINTLSDEFFNAQQFTIEFWMRADVEDQSDDYAVLFGLNSNQATATGNLMLLAMGASDPDRYGQIFLIEEGQPINIPIVGSTFIGDNECHHIAYVRSGNTGTLFVDGQFQGAHTIIYSLDQPILISLGLDWDLRVSINKYRGELDELRIWNDARTVQEIQQNRNNTFTGNEPDLFALYSFNQGLGGTNNAGINTLMDLTNNGNSGELIDFSLNGSISNWVIDPCEPFDCAGNLQGSAIIDDCGNCVEPNDPNFNACLDCAGIPFGEAIEDDCGNCLPLTHPGFNACLDCEGTPDGPAILDDCGVCRLPSDPAFNECVDCLGVPNGDAFLDDCGLCVRPIDSQVNTCVDCNGIPFGDAVFDDCGQCLSPNDPNFNSDCGVNSGLFIPNAFTPNFDGINDEFRIFGDPGSSLSIVTYRIYNRWGGLVYESANFDIWSNNFWWDGTMNGEPVQAGVYIYQILIEYGNGEQEQFAGDVTVFR